MAIGVLDLSIVTDKLVALVSQSIATSRLWAEEPTNPEGTPTGATPGLRPTISVTGDAPDVAFVRDGCQLCVYLFHVAQCKHQMNTPASVSVPVMQGAFPPVQYQPLALELLYLVAAHSTSYIEEQQAMSVALKCFHDNPVVNAVVPLDARKEQFSITMEPETVDMLGGFWQAAGKPLRLSALYRASVVLIEPTEPPADAKPVEEFAITTGPAQLPYGDVPEIVSTSVTVRYTTPDGVAKHYQRSPAIAGPGQTFLIAGSVSAQAKVLFVPADGGISVDLSSWVIAAQTKDSRIALQVPAVGAPLPQVGSLVVADKDGSLSNSVPFAIAPTVSTIGGVSVEFTGVPLNLTGTGFVAGATDVGVGPASLAETGAAPAVGQFQVVDSEHLSVMPPAGLAAGVHPVRVRVNGIDAAPAVWIKT